MFSVPKNNLRQRLEKLGYDPNLAVIKIPEKINVIKQTNTQTTSHSNTSQQHYKREIPQYQPPVDFKPPEILNLDQWSDFEDDE